MPEPLIRSAHVVGEWDAFAHGFAARDWTPGPAGTVGLALRGDVELEVDIASPTTFVGLWAAAPGGTPRRSTTQALHRLLGPDRLAHLLSLRGQPGKPAVLHPLDDDPYEREWNVRRHPANASVRSPARDRDRGVAPGLARVALAAAAGAEPTASGLVRALAHIDAARAAAIFSPGIGFGARARSDAVAGAELLLDVVRRGELDGQPIDQADLFDALHRLIPLLPQPLDREIRTLAERTERGRLLRDDAEPMPAAMALPDDHLLLDVVPDAPRQRPASPVLDVLDRATLPTELAAAQIVVRATTRSELEVRIVDRARDSEGWWTRAFDVDDVIVAAAPFSPMGRDAVARLLVPPDDLRDVEVDVTGQPGEPRPSRRLRLMNQAIAAGRAAARADRLGRRAAASDRWLQCAAAWDRAGDPARSGLATELADGSRRRQITAIPALLADAVIEASSS